MAETPTRYTLDRVVRMVISAGVILAIIALLRYLSDVLIPFVVAVVLAYMLNPLVCVFEQKTKRRGLAVGLTLGGLTILG
jgi:predicted PurR-regulated permease PerM